jgi:hypothetical protein
MIQLGLVDAPRKSSDGAVRAWIALRIDGEEADVVTVRLDSDHARERQAKRWPKEFDLDPRVLGDKRRKLSCKTGKVPQNR